MLFLSLPSQLAAVAGNPHLAPGQSLQLFLGDRKHTKGRLFKSPPVTLLSSQAP